MRRRAAETKETTKRKRIAPRFSQEHQYKKIAERFPQNRQNNQAEARKSNIVIICQPPTPPPKKDVPVCDDEEARRPLNVKSYSVISPNIS